MNHLLKKLSIQGGGFGKKKGGSPPAPPPAELQPPKLGKMQNLASYSYAETIDLISDGPIDGLVNQNGQYVQGNRVFEAIYFDDVPVKKSIDVNYTGDSSVEKADYSITGIGGKLSGKWYSDGEFNEATFTGVLDLNSTVYPASTGNGSWIYKTRSYFGKYQSVNDPYYCLSYSPISYVGNSGNAFECPDPYLRENMFEITWERDDIAKSVYQSVDLLRDVSANPSIYGEDASKVASQKMLRYNYQSWVDIKNDLFPNFVDSSDEEYPFFALKINLGDPYNENETSHCGSTLVTFQTTPKEISTTSDFTVDNYTNTVLVEDVFNQVYEKIEINEAQTKRRYRAPSYLDLTYVKKTSSTILELAGSIIIFGFKGENFPLENSIQAIIENLTKISVVNFNNEKYNYNNVLAEFRAGDDLQPPLAYFDRVYISKEYGIKLPGPFNVANDVFRISNFGDDTGYNIRGTTEFPLSGAIPNEGSTDIRSSKNFSSYAGNNKTSYIEQAIPITHIIDNSNVDRVYLTMAVRALSDTIQIDSAPEGIGSVQAGTKIPTVVRFKVEIGLQDSFGKDVLSSIEERIYQVIGIADSPVLIDIGREENSAILSKYKFLAATKTTGEINASTPIILPTGENGQKRFVRVTRTTFETSSTLIRKEISLEKVTEIISTAFSYPGSTIIGTKIDSRNISQIPPRSYDARLKRVLIPSNYFPLRPDGRDKRRYRTSSDFDAASNSDLEIYKGNWDGTFKEGWTDNPAWILFDLLIDYEYGLGNFVSPDQINVWELYKIGRFCDAVDANGIFQGVPNSFGGKEPRYSTNLILGDKTDVYQTINAVANSFRGSVFYSNSEINFADDRLKIPVFEFSNINVKDGSFAYSSSRRDQEFNVVEVSYNDENDDFKQKIEYVENNDSIRKRGVLKTTVESFGITSKSAANRFGQHIIFGTTDENESISFVAGTDALYLRPGNLVSINDELKTMQRNFGKVRGIYPTEGRVYIDEKFDPSSQLKEITLLAPTGKKSFSEYSSIAQYSGGLTFKDLYANDVPHVQTFLVTGYDNSPSFGSNIYIGPEVSYDLLTFTGITQTGLVGRRTGLYSGNGTFNGYNYYIGVGTPTGYSLSRSGQFWYMRSISSSGIVTSGCSGLSKPTGTWATGGCYESPTYDNKNLDFLYRVQVGTPYSISLSGQNKDVYKVVSIKEVNVNEFEVAGIKFNSGKFAEIESAQNLNDFFGAYDFIQRPKTIQTSSSSNYQLDSPEIQEFTTGDFNFNGSLDISGSWNQSVGAENYFVTLTRPNGSKDSRTTTGQNVIYYDQNQLGYYRLTVTAKTPSLGYSSKSSTSSINAFTTQALISPYIANITIG